VINTWKLVNTPHHIIEKKKERTKRKRTLATRATLKKSGGMNPFFGRQKSNFWLSITWMENPRCQYVLLCAPRRNPRRGGRQQPHQTLKKSKKYKGGKKHHLMVTQSTRKMPKWHHSALKACSILS
jgi:hypothetical protein